jgi:hypothetical protein
VEPTIENNAWVANKKEPVVAKPIEQSFQKPAYPTQQQQQPKQNQNRAPVAAAPASTGKTSWAQLVKGYVFQHFFFFTN